MSSIRLHWIALLALVGGALGIAAGLLIRSSGSEPASQPVEATDGLQDGGQIREPARVEQITPDAVWQWIQDGEAEYSPQPRAEMDDMEKAAELVNGLRVSDVDAALDLLDHSRPDQLDHRAADGVFRRWAAALAETGDPRATERLVEEAILEVKSARPRRLRMMLIEMLVARLPGSVAALRVATEAQRPEAISIALAAGAWDARDAEREGMVQQLLVHESPEVRFRAGLLTATWMPTGVGEPLQRSLHEYLAAPEELPGDAESASFANATWGSYARSKILSSLVESESGLRLITSVAADTRSEVVRALCIVQLATLEQSADRAEVRKVVRDCPDVCVRLSAIGVLGNSSAAEDRDLLRHLATSDQNTYQTIHGLAYPVRVAAQRELSRTERSER